MVLLLVFAIGCQESSITDPTQQFAEDQGKEVKHSDWFQDRPDDTNHNIIGLKYHLSDPRSGALYALNGQVEFKTTFLPDIDDTRKVWVKVELNMSSQLTYDIVVDHPIWKIEKKTVDKLLFTADGPATQKVNQRYSISNREDIELCATYLVSLNKGIKVDAISLRPCKTYVEDDDATN
jgi:hypothetical protein